jgi:hypothetical protein
MILAFNPTFVPKILSGTKIHTIRNGHRWKPGKFIHMATGVRTKNYSQFNSKLQHLQKCISIQSIEIIWINEEQLYPVVYIDGLKYRYYIQHEKEILYLLATNNGFESFQDFCHWFNTDFKGQIIHWTRFKYSK